MLAFLTSATGLKIVGAIALVAFLITGYGIWHHTVYQAGYDTALAKDAPLIAALKADVAAAVATNHQLAQSVDTLKSAYAEQGVQLVSLELAQEDLHKKAQLALAQAVAHAAAAKATIEHLNSIIYGPASATGQLACDQATSILTDLAATRLLH